jgi:hypothetical protein
MKTSFIAVALLLGAGGVYGQAVGSGAAQVSSEAPNQTTNYIVSERGPYYRVWQKVVSTTDQLGNVILSTNQAYVELATGLHYLQNGQWIDSQELIEAFPGGAAAQQGQHKVIFANDAATAGAIDLQMPDGKELRSDVLGLSYFDTATGQSVLIAEVKDSQGQLYPPNVVVYADAFTDFKADVRYTYTKAGFEQDIILRERPPMPEAFGLNSASSVLEVLTEFVSPPTPAVLTNAVFSGAESVLQDQLLDFGSMMIGSGKAFFTGQDELNGVPVCKQWTVMEGRTFLVEQIAIPAIASQLDQLPLPQQASLSPAKGSMRHLVSTRSRMLLELPTPKLAKVDKDEMKVANMLSPARGLVLDYYATISSGQPNGYTFQGDTTYYISAQVNLYSTNIFEGGAVLKYATNASLILVGGPYKTTMNWLSGPYRPVVFTAMDDNSVGELLSGSTGTPTNYYANPALYIPPMNYSFGNFRIAYAQLGLFLDGFEGAITSAQFINCQQGITASSTSPTLIGQVLFSNVKTNFSNLYETVFSIQNATFSGSVYLATHSGGNNYYFTNCVFANVTNLYNVVPTTFSGSYNGFYNCQPFGTSQTTNGCYPFQTVGAGAYYLASGCNFTNAGTTNIDSALLADLNNKTTYPPLVLSNGLIAAPTNWGPTAPRDTDAPDLGYHYDPLDYLVNNMVVSNATMVLTNGVAVGVYGNWGIDFKGYNNVGLVSQGTPLNFNHLTRYQLVQEQPVSLGGGSALGLMNVDANCYAGPSVQMRFTDLSAAGSSTNGSGTSVSWAASGINGCTFQLRDCALHGVGLSYPLTSGYGDYFLLTNNLFERCNLSFTNYGVNQTTIVVTFENDLLHYGSLALTYTTNASRIQSNWNLYNNLFDNVILSENGNGNAIILNDYNAYSTNLTMLADSGGGDLWVTNFDYQIGPLGNYYYPTNGGNLSQLIDAGSVTNAALLGFYHYTTTTNQVKEANTPLDIGLHYIAVDANGNPVDTDGDGIPDYVEDANGNGVVDPGETDWRNPNDPGLLGVWISLPTSSEPLP